MPISLPQNFSRAYDKADGMAFTQSADRVEPGVYIASVCNVEHKVINDKQTLILKFEICHNTDGTQSTEENKTVEMKPFYLTDKAIFRFAGFLKMLNVTVSDRQVFRDEALIGRYAAIQVDIESYTGSDGNQHTKTIVSQVAPPAEAYLNAETRDASTCPRDLPF